MRQCNWCQFKRHESGFRKNSRICKKCVYQKAKDRQKAWKEAHSKETSEYQEQYRAENASKLSKQKSEWYFKNRNKVLERQRSYGKTGKGKEVQNKASHKHYHNNPRQRRVYTMVKVALKNGSIERGECYVGYNESRTTCKGRIEAHHWDYDEPFEITWLCKRHHGIADKLRRDGEMEGTNKEEVDKELFEKWKTIKVKYGIKRSSNSKALARINSQRYEKRNREKRKAYKKVHYALKTGKLVKGPCATERFGWTCEGKIEAHHWDYSKPLDVVWFCKKHHALADNIRRLMDQDNHHSEQ